MFLIVEAFGLGGLNGIEPTIFLFLPATCKKWFHFDFLPETHICIMCSCRKLVPNIDARNSSSEFKATQTISASFQVVVFDNLHLLNDLAILNISYQKSETIFFKSFPPLDFFPLWYVEVADQQFAGIVLKNGSVDVLLPEGQAIPQTMYICLLTMRTCMFLHLIVDTLISEPSSKMFYASPSYTRVIALPRGKPTAHDDQINWIRMVTFG